MQPQHSCPVLCLSLLLFLALKRVMELVDRGAEALLRLWRQSRCLETAPAAPSLGKEEKKREGRAKRGGSEAAARARPRPAAGLQRTAACRFAWPILAKGNGLSFSPPGLFRESPCCDALRHGPSGSRSGTPRSGPKGLDLSSGARWEIHMGALCARWAMHGF